MSKKDDKHEIESSIPDPFTVRSFVAELVKELQYLLPVLELNERVELFNSVAEGYCKHCGHNDPHHCQCQNDE